MRQIVIFLIILILAAFLRFYNLSHVPPGVNRDEASIGYTAYSLIKTGKDEYGRMFPVSFQSFGDWKLPFYIYTTIPFVWLFGISELAVRVPSALFGTLTVGLTFFLVRLLFPSHEGRMLAILTTFFIAISPWHLHLSRVESESNTGVFLTVLAVVLLLKGMKGTTWLLTPSFILFALTYFTYAGNYVFTTLLLIGIFIFFRSKVPYVRHTFIGIVVFTALCGFIFYHTLLGANVTKAQGISIFSNPSIIHAKIELPRNEHENPQSFISRLTHNRLVFALEAIAQNYLNAYSSDFLFIKGGENKAHNIQGFGNMYLIEAPFLFLGMFYLARFKKGRERNFVFWWFFVAPVAASFTKDAPHSNRMFAIFPMLPLMTAGGVYYFITLFSRHSFLKKAVLGGLAFLLVLNMGIYLDRYYVHFPRNEVAHWGAGWRELTKAISDERFAKRHVVITNPQHSPYIFLLFYSAYDPTQYQGSAVRYPPTSDKFVHVKQFGRYEFRHIDWNTDIQLPNTILIDAPSRIPDFVTQRLKRAFDIALPNGEIMFSGFLTP